MLMSRRSSYEEREHHRQVMFTALTKVLTTLNVRFIDELITPFRYDDSISITLPGIEDYRIYVAIRRDGFALIGHEYNCTICVYKHTLMCIELVMEYNENTVFTNQVVVPVATSLLNTYLDKTRVTCDV